MNKEYINLDSKEDCKRLIAFLAVNCHNLIQNGSFFPQDLDKVKNMLEICKIVSEKLDEQETD